MRKDKIIDLVAVVTIALVGLLTAYVCFGLLQSEASGEFQQYSVGGAIAGALASVSLLSTTYLQIRKSGSEIQKLRETNQELQQKIIRGAPRPPGFDTEVSERQRIVLAGPKIGSRVEVSSSNTSSRKRRREQATSSAHASGALTR
ncbi:MAG: hypothetical protein M3N45_10400 [Actinomycetota bacterium]|nr:hypothetical protein [Actinomycetota bacterium]